MTSSRFFAAPPKATADAVRLTAPKHCQLCNAPAQIVFLAVRKGAMRLIGAPSEFLEKGTLRDDCTFGNWIARCDEHYMRDLYRAKRGVWSEISDTGIPTLDEVERFLAASKAARNAADGGEPGAKARDVGGDPAHAPGRSGADDGATCDGPKSDSHSHAWDADRPWDVGYDDGRHDGGHAA